MGIDSLIEGIVNYIVGSIDVRRVTTGDNHNRSADGTDDDPEFERRQVLSGIGGMAAMGSVSGLVGGTPDDMADRWADQLPGVTTARDREELAYLIGEMRRDGALLATHDLAELGPAKRREFAAKGRRLKSMMAGDCGPEPLEFDGGKYDPCCEFHDGCEGYNDAPDHVFNGDECDDAFWSCVSNI